MFGIWEKYIFILACQYRLKYSFLAARNDENYFLSAFSVCKTYLLCFDRLYIKLECADLKYD